MRWTTSSSTAVYYHRNQQYSVTALTDASGAVLERYAYSAYGVPTFCNPSGVKLQTSNFAIRHTYTGREWDNDIQQYHYRARMFDPALGRFCSRDPIGLRFGLKSAELHRRFKFERYTVVDNRPLNSMDPSGMISIFPGDDWTSEDLKDALNDIKDAIEDILNGPTDPGEGVGFPIGPDDIIDVGTETVDVLVDFVFKAGDPKSACGKWFKNTFRCTICTTANCDISCCDGISPRDHNTYPASSLWGQCADELLDGKKLPAVKEKLKVNFWKWASKLEGNCNTAPSKSKCCKANPNKVPAFVPVPEEKCPTKCSELRKKCVSKS